MVPHARDELYFMSIEPRTGGPETVEHFSGIGCKFVPVEPLVHCPCPEGERDGGAVLRRGVPERFTSGHRARTGQIISIVRGQPLASVPAFGNPEEIDPVRVYVPAGKSQAEEFLPGVLLGFLPPAVPLPFVWYLRDEINGRGVFESVAETEAVGPFPVLRARAMQVQEHRISVVWLLPLAPPVERHHGIGLKGRREGPLSGHAVTQGPERRQTFIIEPLHGLLPYFPHLFACLHCRRCPQTG